MAKSQETCSGLLWMGSRTAPWVCRADTHVYSVHISELLDQPPERPTLHWRTFVLTDQTWRYAYVQVHESSPTVQIAALEVDGLPWAIRPWSPSGA